MRTAQNLCKLLRMANNEHFKLIRKGPEAWNVWRHENSDTAPDLRGADLRRAHLIGVDLSRTDLSQSELFRADLTRADLHGTNLTGQT